MIEDEGRKSDQAVAMCHSIWKDKNKEENSSMEHFRVDVARGLKDGKNGVDRENEIIKGFAVVSKGITHDRRGEFDDAELNRLVQMGNESEIGLKSRFGHPNMSGTALGTFLGRIKSFRKDGDVVRGDLYIDETAHDTPDGDLANYVMKLAESDPDAFGSSMVINWEPELRYVKDDEPEKDEEGNDLPPFIRVSKFREVDIVDDPAANNGMFGTQFFDNTNVKFSAEMTAFLDKFLNSPDAIGNVMGFLQRYSDNRDYKERLMDDKSSGKKLSQIKEGEIFKKEGKVDMEKIFSQEEFDTALAEKTQELQNSITEKDTKIAEGDSSLQEKNNVIVEKENAIAERDTKLSEQEDAIKEKDTKLSEQEDAIKEKDEAISGKDNELAKKDEAIKKFEAEKKVDKKWSELSVDYNEEDADEIKGILLKSELGETLTVQDTEILLKKKVGSSLPAGSLSIDSEISKENKDKLRRFAGIRSKKQE